MLGSPRDAPRLPRLSSPPPSARQSLHSHRSQPHSARRRNSQQQQQLELLDLAFQGHGECAAFEAFELPPMLTTAASTSTLLQDESARMEAADPELFHAGVEEHARRLGMDPERERDFLWLARESLVAPLPDGWFHATASESGAPYYYNDRSGESRWDHPCDDQFRQIYRELKLQQQQQQAQAQQLSRRYDHYGSPALSDASSSYYATSSAYQTLAWQDDAAGGGGANGAADNAAHSGYHASPDMSLYADYDPQQQLQEWRAGAVVDPTQADESAGLYDEYAYDVTQPFEDQTPEYDAASVPEAPRPSASARSSLADPPPPTERQWLAQTAQDEQAICDLHVQVQSLSKQLEAQEAAHDALLSDKRALESKLGDYKEQLDGYARQCEELGEKNRTLKRELLAARNRLEQQETTEQSSVDEAQRLAVLVATEQSLRADAARARDELATAQSRSGKELEAARSQLAELQAELAALRAAEQQRDARASATHAADATVTAAVVTTLTTQLSAKQEELEAAQRSVQELAARIEALEADHAQSTAVLADERQDAATLRSELQSAAETRVALERRLAEQMQLGTAQRSEAEEQNRVLKRESRAFERDLKAAQTAAKEREEELRVAQRRAEALESSLVAQEAVVESARQVGFAEAERASAELVRQAQAEKARVADLYAHELQARRQLHNRLMELQGNIRVFCRVRPIQPVELKSEQAAPAIFFREHDPASLELLVGGGGAADSSSSSSSSAGASSDGAKGSSNLLGQKHAFEFDHVFPPTSSQAQVFEQTRALIVSALDGFNDRGVNFRALQELFRLRAERVAAGGVDCAMKLSILEVYNESVVDLLDTASGGAASATASATAAAPAKGLDVRMGKAGVYVDNLIEVEVFSESDVLDLMRLGHSHRSVGAHDVNEHSSRSHLPQAGSSNASAATASSASALSLTPHSAAGPSSPAMRPPPRGPPPITAAKSGQRVPNS
ncbi:hypothetical protein PybrP1_001381 [[Pythium] brassicae (nom. inval.)]|nr:hypothetical protein PybrP1_001381 [[Pythium] brassicae (nom. inval.)]